MIRDVCKCWHNRKLQPFQSKHIEIISFRRKFERKQIIMFDISFALVFSMTKEVRVWLFRSFRQIGFFIFANNFRENVKELPAFFFRFAADFF